MHSTDVDKEILPHSFSCNLNGKRRHSLYGCIILISLLSPLLSISQNLNLSVHNTSLEKVFRQIEKQTPYRFVYAKESLEDASNISIDVKNATLEQVLGICFKSQPLTYSITDNIIMIKAMAFAKAPGIDSNTYKVIAGWVLNELGEPLPGATVAIKGKQQATSTDMQGLFTLKDVPLRTMLIISNVGYITQTYAITSASNVFIRMQPSINTLDETIVIAYGTTTRRLNTGSVSKVSAKEIERQPVSNPLAALQGRVPGLLITQKNGLPGSAFSVQLRGVNSLKQGTQPLFLIDGIPLMLNNGSLSQLAPDNQSILNTINPSDIESIEILKDADATAIYGSQGANGVVLITTKKGKEGKTKLDINIYTGYGKITRTVDLLNTADYLQMRREGFTNDGIIPSLSNAPDLLLWDSAASTDWRKVLIGGTAKTSNIQATLTGGNAMTSFLLSGNYYSESTVFPEAVPAKRASIRLSLNHTSPNKKFNVNLNTAFAADIKNQPFADITKYILLPPNAPSLYDSSGKLNWVTDFDNPVSYLLEKYTSETDNFSASGTFNYQVLKYINLKLNVGYERLQLSEQRKTPIKAQRPSATTTGSIQSSTGNLKSWLAEPQLNYKKEIGPHKVEALAGLSYQERIQTRLTVLGTGYTSDDLLGSLSAASLLSSSNSISQYRYAALFGRINYQLAKKYILNGNIRRDGSSRFGPANRFSNFGAFGAGWIISEEGFVKKSLHFISYAKLRSSYGVIGNDQIGDYQYLDAWTSSTSYRYAGIAGLLPSRLFNSSYQWERTRKIEGALELGFFKDRMFISSSFYSNRSNNQLVSYKLPSQTGFTTIIKNLDALVQNNGWEFEINSKIIKQKQFSWQANFDLTIPRNKLLNYPGLETSSDKLNFAIGQPLNTLRTFTYVRVNPQNGQYVFNDIDKDGKISSPNDLTNIEYIGTKYYGGLDNEFSYNNIQLHLFFAFNKQTGRSYLANLTDLPGALSNQPTLVMERWQRPGDLTSIQKFSSVDYLSYINYGSSSALISDASFIRLKNISLTYNISKKLLQKIKVDKLQLFFEGQNLLTITKYNGTDPETQNLLALPPLKMFATGFRLIL